MKFVPKEPIDNNSTGLDNGLAPNKRQAIIWTNADPVHWRIYAALGGKDPVGHSRQYPSRQNKILNSNCRPRCADHSAASQHAW